MRRIWCLLGALGLLGGLFFLWAEDPSTSFLFPPCPFHYLTGLYCPGCGTLRAIHSLLHGRILQALSFNLLSVLALPVLAWALLARWVHCVFGIRLWLPRFRPWLSKTLVLIVLLFWLLRNIPIEPFVWLAPGHL